MELPFVPVPVHTALSGWNLTRRAGLAVNPLPVRPGRVDHDPDGLALIVVVGAEAPVQEP